MLVEAQAKASFGQPTSKRGLADLKRIAPQVVAVEFDEVEGVEEYSAVSAVVTDEIERGNAVVIAGDSFAVDDAGAGAQAGQRSGDAALRNPITGIACCARATSGHVTAAPLSSDMNSRRFNRLNCIRSPPARAGLQDIELAMVSQRVYDHAPGRVRAR
jgi:hypothetical protein